MAISFECGACGKKLTAPDAAAGQSSKCPSCGRPVTCPAPPAQPRSAPESEREDLDPYGLVDPDPDPYAPPRAAPEEPEGPSPGRGARGMGKKRAQLRRVAVAQKGIIVVILLQILCYVAFFVLPPDLKFYASLGTLVLSLASLYFIFSLAMSLYSTVVGIILCILSLIPCINLLVLLSMNGKATTILREAGHHVGFMGANLAEFESK